MIRADIRAVIFDMDGLMLDSEPVARDAWRAAIRAQGCDLSDELFRRTLGLRHAEAGEFLKRQFGLSVTVETLVAARNENFFALLPGRLRAMPGLFELLDELKLRGLRRAIATSGDPRYVDMVLRGLKLEGVFEVIVTSQDVTRGKPAPDVYLAAAERLGVPPAHCLVLEDAPTGVAAAQAAGMTCIAVPNEYTRFLDLSAADAILPSLLTMRDELASMCDAP